MASEVVQVLKLLLEQSLLHAHENGVILLQQQLVELLQLLLTIDQQHVLLIDLLVQ
jgi:hypothetical protein